ncbi:fatty acid--CoA ligase family protein [Acetobacter senegalensis]|uniref:ANL family adenylate-forming protein n=1 Tax=Acetobacter senegalensis TaxID=446692 RepID=UPI00209F8A09|nr:fatty acid--CoA ligase family protein [Acetobacter senegalensis]MCP1197504.1 fatty acid--CoA ligase family protein [Acetobacter senegalensis]
MELEEFLSPLSSIRARDAIVFGNDIISYDDLILKIEEIKSNLLNRNIFGNTIVFIGDYGPSAIATLIALWLCDNTVCMVSKDKCDRVPEISGLTGATFVVDATNEDEISFRDTGHESYEIRVSGDRAKFIIFSSGTTGAPKGIIHRVDNFIKLYRDLSSPPRRTLGFYFFDHMGGIITILSTLISGSTLVIPQTRSPADVWNTIHAHEVEVASFSPSFINLSLASGIFHEASFPALKEVRFGTEPMNDITLTGLNAALPSVVISQLYGMSEVGVPPAYTNPSNPLELRFDPRFSDTKIVNGELFIRTTTMADGYVGKGNLPLTEGYFETRDLVQEDASGYLAILGRQDDLINVGGEKYSPSEIERVLIALPNVEDVAVYAVPHVLMGNVVGAAFRLKEPEDLLELRRRIRWAVRDILKRSQVPQEIEIVEDDLYTDRYKKRRNFLIR